MRAMLKVSLVVGLALGLTSAAQAQRQGPGFGPGGMLMAPAVQKELKLSDDQVTKLKDSLGKVRENHKDDFAKFQDLSREERQKLMKSVNEESHKAIAGVLDAKQMKRFKQIQWQTGGVRVFADPQVQKALKLTDEQKKKLKTIFDESDKKMQELFQGGNREGAREKFQALRKEMHEKADAVLTDEQKKNWKEMKGETFEFPRRNP